MSVSEWVLPGVRNGKNWYANYGDVFRVAIIILREKMCLAATKLAHGRAMNVIHVFCGQGTEFWTHGKWNATEAYLAVCPLDAEMLSSRHISPFPPKTVGGSVYACSYKMGVMPVAIMSWKMAS